MNNYTKEQRQAVLAEILLSKIHRSQVSLLKELCKRGIGVTQATVSRDLQEMGYIKVRRRPGGFHYVKHESEGTGELWERLRVLFKNFVQEVNGTGNLLLVKTSPGNANGVASLIDRIHIPKILGTVAGDDTILVVADSERHRKDVEKEFLSLI